MSGTEIHPSLHFREQILDSGAELGSVPEKAIVVTELMIPLRWQGHGLLPFGVGTIDEVDIPGELAASWKLDGPAVGETEILRSIPVERRPPVREQMISLNRLLLVVRPKDRRPDNMHGQIFAGNLCEDVLGHHPGAPNAAWSGG